MSFLKVSDIQVKVEKFLLKNISFELKKGQILAILGPSGAGKTLLLETIAGFYIPNSGQIYLD
ncbi:MAG: ATP-binding cassette domain-containing protein, partial [Thermodesulfobium sp.]